MSQNYAQRICITYRCVVIQFTYFSVRGEDVGFYNPFQSLDHTDTMDVIRCCATLGYIQSIQSFFPSQYIPQDSEVNVPSSFTYTKY